MEITSVESLVLETLKRAASQNAEVLKPAEEKLKEWEIEPGFYSILWKIISNHSIDVTVRWLAVLYFKNGVDRYWRRSAPNAIQELEKAILRNNLMEAFIEPVNQVATQLAVLISKVARFDCPREWPELIPLLLEVVKSKDLLVQHRGLLTLYHVIKTLASKRLAGDRRLFQQLTSDVYSFVLNLWNSHFETFFSQIQSNDPQYLGTLEKALLSLRILRKLTVHGFKQPHESEDAVMFITVVFDRAKSMLHCRKSLGNNPVSMTELVEKVTIHLTKVLLSVLEHHPFSYLGFIERSLQFSVTLLFTAEGEGLLFERFIIQCLNLIKGILLCAEYKPPKFVEESRETATLEAHRIKSEFFQTEILSEICRKLITHYFLLTAEDLQLWDSDPENFATDDAGESWKYSLRPCTESIFMALFHEFRDVLSPVLLELIRDNHQIVNPQDLSAILRKDAVYNAVGLAAFDLYDEVDFDQWFSTSLIQELAVKEPNYRVIRRRVAWLIGRWTGVKLSPELRPTLYNALIPLLRGDEDMAVRLAAAVSLKQAVDDFEFSSDQFIQFLEPVFTLLFSLLQEAKECDTKIQVLFVLSFVVERVGVSIRPYSSSLIQYLPLLWEESVNHNMLRCAIVGTLVQFVRALVTENLTAFLFPVIELCTDVKQDAYVYLLEDGLELWFAVLENSTTLTPQLFHLYKVMPSVLEFTSEYLHCCCYIIQAYILLSPQEFLMEYGESMIASCVDLMTDMNSEGIVMIFQVIETAIRANATLAVSLSLPILSDILLRIHLGEDLTMLMSMSLAISCRVLLFSREVFSQVIEKAAASKSQSSESFLERILMVWINTMPLVTQKEKRKLLALALSSLLTVQSPVVMGQFSGILRNVVEALHDIVDVDESSVQVDSLVVTEQFCSSDDHDTGLETENERRKKQLRETDPVYNTVLTEYLQGQWNDLKSQLGANNFESLLLTVDSETLQQCRSYIIP